MASAPARAAAAASAGRIIPQNLIRVRCICASCYGMRAEGDKCAHQHKGEPAHPRPAPGPDRAEDGPALLCSTAEQLELGLLKTDGSFYSRTTEERCNADV